ncbi:MAG: type II toxin-antitoxin system PemK/MazF family toxin [Tepidiformaceae bacterium]
MNRGDVYWCCFPTPDQRRPVVILTRESALSFLEAITVVPITSSVRSSPTYVRLGLADGLFEECAANLDGIQTVRSTALGEYISRLSSTRMDQIAEAAMFAFALG